MSEEIIFSRPNATAARLGDLAPDRHIFINKKILLTGETAILMTANGRVCFMSSFLLLHRISKGVEVYLPPDVPADFQKECEQLVKRYSRNSSIILLATQPDHASYDAILSVGSNASASPNWTVINSNGWLARISSGSVDISADTDQYNPVAALAAACLGVTEVFKRLIGLIASRGKLLGSLTFSLYSYKVGDLDPGPPLPPVIDADLLLSGVGAIGNGIIFLLSQLPLTGRVRVVDYQQYGPENIGTCLLIGELELEKDKALFAEAYLGSRLATGYVEDIQVFSKRLGTEIPYPKIVLNGLDDIDARHYVQDLWPDMIIDGAIGDFAAQVSLHPWSQNTACLKCLFQKPAGEASEVISSRATGLRPERISNEDDVVSDRDIAIAPETKKAWLQARKGRKICSVIQESVAQHISNDALRRNFEPSVPFVACLSASMVVAEFIKYVQGWGSYVECRYQLDVLTGPERGDFFPQDRRKDCVCVTRRRNIEIVRKGRG
jgi:molybdopterin/thiamine biosynthesis adenylyltransferase